MAGGFTPRGTAARRSCHIPLNLAAAPRRHAHGWRIHSSRHSRSSFMSHTVVARDVARRLLVVSRSARAVLGGARVDRRPRNGIGAEVRVRARGARVAQLDAALGDLLAGLIVLAAEREARLLFELVVPLPERVAVPRPLRTDLRESELVPDLEGVLHVILRRK